MLDNLPAQVLGAIRGVPRCDLGAFQPNSMGWKTISTASLPSKVTTGTTLSYQRESIGNPVVALPSSSTRKRVS